MYRDVADVKAHTTKSREVALAIEVMDEGKLEFRRCSRNVWGILSRQTFTNVFHQHASMRGMKAGPVRKLLNLS